MWLILFADCNDVFDGIYSCPDLDQKRKERHKTQHLKGMDMDVYTAHWSILYLGEHLYAGLSYFKEGPTTGKSVISHYNLFKNILLTPIFLTPLLYGEKEGGKMKSLLFTVFWWCGWE